MICDKANGLQSVGLVCKGVYSFFFFFSSRRRHTRCREVSWARRCVQETGYQRRVHGEPLMLSVGTAVTVGIVLAVKKNQAEVMLKRPVCAELGSRIAISRQVGGRWRLIGIGLLTEQRSSQTQTL
eukprot:TRINITY_DN31394_c0_g1_i2.p4 TRINITY_DN31394_c0_g1~~TRINITY_DN31394_c0_g1_i2.p4  ORF type:complete len:126 (+),score=38.04 TRINITY_DN31394_c0_g1_i2:36-413(+)